MGALALGEHGNFLLNVLDFVLSILQVYDFDGDGLLCLLINPFEENRKLLSEIARLIRAWLLTEHVPLVHLAEGALSNPLLLLIELFGVCVALLREG